MEKSCGGKVFCDAGQLCICEYCCGQVAVTPDFSDGLRVQWGAAEQQGGSDASGLPLFVLPPLQPWVELQW